MNIVAGALTGVGPGSGWRMGPDEAAANHCVAGTLTAGMFEGSPGGGDGKDGGLVIAHTLRGEGFDASEDGTGRGTPLVMAFDTTQITSPANRSAPKPGDPCHPLAASAHAPAIAFNARQDPIHGPVNGPLDTDGTTSAVMNGVAVRRITPTEAERLQGFEDGYTAIAYRGKPAADGPRYRALGNSWAVNCARWVGQRIACVDAIAAVELAA